MNSALRESVQGFLNRRSVSHSVELLPKSGVTPASSSSQFSIGVTSTATVGPKLDPPPLKFQFAAPPSSTTATGSLSADCANALPAHRNNNANKTGFVAFTGYPPPNTPAGFERRLASPRSATRRLIESLSAHRHGDDPVARSGNDR